MESTSDFILKVEELTVNRAGRNVLDQISFSLYKNENLAIVGPSGSGKTTLGLALAQKIFYKGNIEFYQDKNKICLVEQQHHFKNLQNTNDLYYQQRYNSYDTEETMTVIESLGNVSDELNALFTEMKIDYLKNERLIQLSNGENKKLQLLKALIEKPTVLILDQPFIGLDKDTRSYLKKQIDIIAESGVLVILITMPDEIPDCISKIITLKDGKLNAFEGIEIYRKSLSKDKHHEIKKYLSDDFKKLLSKKSNFSEYEAIIEMKNVSVEYDEKKILNDISWKVLPGERWLLSGPNGAGKSTLLSLITADNPKAYANNVFLFGKKRGSGESIWDIKKQIGFLSPELHLFFNQSSTVFETIASGIYDTIGLFRQLSQKEIELVVQWMDFCHVKDIEKKRLYELSAGEQRVILLIRALIKNPPLLILDEPCQGLDDEKTNEFIELINEVCITGNKTLVFVSHYENQIPECITRFIKLDKGQVTEMK